MPNVMGGDSQHPAYQSRKLKPFEFLEGNDLYCIIKQKKEFSICWENVTGKRGAYAIEFWWMLPQAARTRFYKKIKGFKKAVFLFKDQKKKEDQKQFFVTHVVTEPVPNIGLRKLSFITRKHSMPGKYFVGFGTHRPFSKRDFTKKIKSGSLVVLPKNIKIARNQCLWLSRKGEIFLADSKDPIPDKLRKQIYP